MDWVKQKKNRSKSHKSIHSELNDPSAVIDDTKLAPATAWLEHLCQENVALLQQSLPVAGTKRKSKSALMAESSTLRMATAVQWGSTILESELDEGPEVLQRVVKLLATPLPSKIDAKQPKAVAARELYLKTAENVAKWIVRSLPVHGHDPFVGLVSVAWVHGLRELGAELQPSLWLETLQSVLTQVDRAWSIADSEDLYPWLIWACEVPLALATQLSQLGSKDRMVIETLNRLALALETSEDDPAPWLKNGARNLRALLASVIRTRWAADALDARRLFAPQRKAIAKLSCLALALTDSDGQPLLHETELGGEDDGIWPALVAISSPCKNLVETISAVFPKKSILNDIAPVKTITEEKIRVKSKDKLEPKKHVSKTRLPEPGMYCENAELATMRRSWEQSSYRIAVDYARDPIWIDCLGAGGERLISGEWDVAVRRNGKPLDVDVGWSEVCWFTDDDVDYLEVECAVEGKCRIQRQIMLIRDEGVFFFSDTLLAQEKATWALDSTWTIAPDFQFKQNAKNHEAELFHRDSDGQRRALLLPLALPEWKRQPSIGKLSEKAGQLILTQEFEGTRLFCPLLIAARKSSRGQPYTWRHLTVAEDLEIQPRDIAQAYRVQIGKDQLVFYRSLAKTVRRTAMGLHLNTEFYAGRFDSDEGEFDSIVEISSDD